MNKQDISVCFLCAGVSSRFNGKIKQFAVVGINGETLMEVSLNQALKAGFSKIVFIVGNKTEIPFREKFGNSYKGIPVFYAVQKFDENERDKPWGTADATASMFEIVKEPFVLMNGDDIYGERTFRILAEHLKTSEDEAIPGYHLLNVLPETGTGNRGLIEIENGYLKNITEILGISRENYKEKGLDENSLISLNAFALHPRVILMLKERIEKFKIANKGDRKIEFFLPNEIGELTKLGKIKVKCLETPDRWIGVTSPGDEEIVKSLLLKN
jgi:choline kinase